MKNPPKDCNIDLLDRKPMGVGTFVMSDRAKAKWNAKDGWHVYLRWQGKRYFFSYYLGIKSFRHDKNLAQSSATIINSEIDKQQFRPERWIYQAKKEGTVESYSQGWLERMEPSLAQATIHDYRNSFHNHINPVIGPTFLEDVNKDRLIVLLNSIKREGKGKKNVMAVLKQMFKDAYESGHISQVPVFPRMTGKNQIVKPQIKWLEPQEQFQILEAIPKHHRPIFTFLMLTGCRPSEARAFRREDIRSNHIVFAVAFGHTQKDLKEVKGKKVMPFPLTEALKELFDSTPRYLSPFVFLNEDTGKAYNRNIQRDIFNPAVQKVGMNIRLNEFGRKSFAMQALEFLDRGPSRTS